MCGIAGLFVPRDAAPPDVDIGAMLARLGHRGPDGTGTWTSDDRRFRAGFARLAIIDLAGGDQPLIDSHQVLTSNGEIYNYLELRRDLAGEGVTFRTEGDMEPILPLARRDGEDFLHRLNGMFALALYDRQAHSLLLARDRLGIKPLYWTRLPGGAILYASEPSALFASGLIRPELDESAIAPYLAHGYIPHPQTLYKGVRKLAPGAKLTVSADGTIREEYWWQPRPADDLPGDAGAAEAHIDALIGDAVRLQLRSDVPVGALLSGGVDSGLVVARAAEHAGGPLRSFTVSFEGAAYDEGPVAADVARRYGTDHTAFHLSQTEILDHLPHLAWYNDEPLADAALLPNDLIHRELSKELRVVLNGTGGDEIFGGYMRYFPTAIEQRYGLVPGFLRSGLIEPLIALADPMKAWQLSRTGLFGSHRGRYVHAHSTYFAPPVLKRLGCRLDAADPAHAALADRFGGNGQAAGLAADIGSYLVDNLLTLLDRTSMAWSVEGRVPLLDHRLVEAALALPEDQRTPGGRPKGLERAIARKYLPESVTDAPKQGFASPVPAWIRSGLGSLAERVLTRDAALERGGWTRDGIAFLLADPDRHGPGCTPC
jgi:asparagine synthase (glutamine-hydrolysing)